MSIHQKTNHNLKFLAEVKEEVHLVQKIVAEIPKGHNACILDYLNKNGECGFYVYKLSGVLKQDLIDFMLNSIKNNNQMNLSFNLPIAQSYKSLSQKVRVLSEDWVARQSYCPSCGSQMVQSSNNSPVFDFICPRCREEFELKSKKKFLGKKIVDGAYQTMIERLKAANNPNLFFLNYHPETFQVLNFLVIPKHFFVPDIIERRTPLSTGARRAGWVGCNILLNRIPQVGRIFLIKDKQVESKEKVQAVWQKTLFLREEKKAESKGWLLDVMRCIEFLGKTEFKLADIYKYESMLAKQHPENRHIKDKVRQQLQILRDRKYIQFTGRGEYRII